MTSTSSDGTVSNEGEPQTPVVPAYNPNYKFKSFDKEYEMDDFIRSVIKDKDTESKVRSIYEKAYGLDVIKPRYQEVRENHQKLQTEHKTLTENIGMLENYLNQGNFDEFFKTLQIPEKSIYQYVLDKLNYQDMPAEQKRTYDQFNQYRNQATLVERQNQQLQQRYEQESVALRSLQLDSVITRPDIKSIIDAYDSRKGKPGSFRDRVILEGQAVARATGEDLTPEEAVKRTIDLLDLQMAQQAEAAQASPTAAAPSAQAAPPVIPHVAGKSSSPARKVYNSIDSLKKRAAELSV